MPTASAPAHRPAHCPRCEYDLASLRGAPERSDGVFAIEVACPECGFVVPERGRVIEGSMHPVNLGATPQVIWVMAAINGAFFVMACWFVIGPLQGLSLVPKLGMLIGPGGVTLSLAFEIWRRSRWARRSTRVAPPGREIRWVVSPAGLDRIDRSRLLRAPRVETFPATRVHRVMGAPAEVTVRSREGSRETADAALLIAWSWKTGAAGRIVDVVPTAIYTMDGIRPGEASGTQAEALATSLERTLGVAIEGRERALPPSLFADPRAKLRFIKAVAVAGMIVAAAACISLIPDLNPDVDQFTLTTILIAAATIPPAAILAGVFGTIASWRRRWARRHAPGLDRRP
ncbi:MAG: hypothetical protein RJA16_1124 [Planctomycetota bacterium]|jgi:hypothetical protein